MPYFDYRQNNSGGSFDYSRFAYGAYVIIEADNADQADYIARDVGLHFDGYGDCSCCGDRWSEQYGNGTLLPSIYGSPIDPNTLEKPFLASLSEQYVIIHHADGRVEGWTWGDKKNRYRVEFK